jgi:cell wall-associated NlpC family hydrolase
LRIYVQGAAQVGAQTAIGKALDQLQALHQVESRLQATEATIATDEQKAATANSAAQTAAAQAQAAAQAATTQQQQLLLTVAQAGGNLAPLVAAAQAAEAQAAFNRFQTGGGLDFAPPAALPAPSARSAAVVQVAEAQVGKPYVWGAAGPDSFDCSGLVVWSWAHAGVGVPRVAADQQAWATPVPISQLAPGDLVFFGAPAHHVGIYVGGGLMVDAPHSGANVQVVPIWWDDLAGFGRIHA